MLNYPTIILLFDYQVQLFFLFIILLIINYIRYFVKDIIHFKCQVNLFSIFINYLLYYLNFKNQLNQFTSFTNFINFITLVIFL